ncbi:MAG: NAD(P)-dependent oxidoreductase [Planctomycetia bacterium]|nr:NAD(P)-dependent oxidoreductase [Planctomycetia bacterium]
MVPLNIVLCYPVEEKHLRKIRQTAGEGFQIINAGQEHVREALFQADLFCGHAKVPVDWDGVVRQGRLRWLQSSAAGMDHCLVPSVIASEITVTSASGVLANQVAEHELALLLGLLRSLPVFFRAKEKQEFIRRPTNDLYGKKVGIVGLGGVGRRLAEVLSVFGTTLYAVDMFPIDKPACVKELWGLDKMEKLFAECDIISLNLPLNASTRNLVDEKLLNKMKRGAILANLARGGIVDTEALVEALRSGLLSGAVMDVTEPEPLPPGHALWDLENVLITPHVGGQCASRIDDMTRMFCENLRRWKAGEPLINYLSDKSLGFPIRSAEHPLWVDVDKTILWEA